MTNSSRSYYSVLGIDPNASQEEIRGMYYKLAKKYHADANSDDPQLRKWSHAMMTELNEAYSILKDPGKRKEYDARRNNSDQNRQESIYIQTVEQGVTTLIDGINSFPFGAPSLKLEEDCKKEATNLIKRHPQKYLTLGVPHSYPVAYLAAGIEQAAAEAMEQVQERSIRRNVFFQFFTAILLIEIFAAFRKSRSLSESVFAVLGEVIVAALFYLVITWIARFIARGFKSNLTAMRGRIVNNLVAISVLILFISKLFFSPEGTESWKRYVSNDKSFSVLLPSRPKEEYNGIFNLNNGKKTLQKKMSVAASEQNQGTEYSITWASHPDIPNEYMQWVENHERVLTKSAGAKVVAKQKINDKMHSFVFDLPDTNSIALKILLKNETIFFVGVVTGDENIKARSLQSFLNSFKTE